jgi:adenosylcobyric acid synthase
VVFKEEKVVKKSEYELFGLTLLGYEIHNGYADELFFEKEKLYGTFVHGLFDNNTFRNRVFKSVNDNYKGFDFSEYKDEKIKSFTQEVGKHVDIERLIKSLD